MPLLTRPAGQSNILKVSEELPDESVLVTEILLLSDVV